MRNVSLLPRCAAALRAVALHGAASRWPVNEDAAGAPSRRTRPGAPLPARLSLSMKCRPGTRRRERNGEFCGHSGGGGSPLHVGDRRELRGVGRRRELEGRPRTSNCLPSPLNGRYRPPAGTLDDRLAKLAGQQLIPGPYIAVSRDSASNAFSDHGPYPMSSDSEHCDD